MNENLISTRIRELHFFARTDFFVIWFKVFRCTFSHTVPIFFNRIKSKKNNNQESAVTELYTYI